jgi:pimeloyl-ACP methyl ester carboxylesterase
LPNSREEVTDEKYGTHHVIDRPGCHIHYWLAGPANAPLVALSHAALVDHTFFASQVPALVSRFRVMSWDIRGHGASRPLDGSFAIPHAVDDLVAILDSVGAARASCSGSPWAPTSGRR